MRALGADEVLDSARPDPAEEITGLTGGVDLVLESVGRATFEVSLSVTKSLHGRRRRVRCRFGRRRTRHERPGVHPPGSSQGLAHRRARDRGPLHLPVAARRTHGTHRPRRAPARRPEVPWPRGRRCCSNWKRARPAASTPSTSLCQEVPMGRRPVHRIEPICRRVR
ncbi:zinc-binding dehydrogenase [Streptomyces sp. Ru72]|uniref:zinc-binding dehydrogenase n=1 Tax=Streptomyces sp. Ru72 TaxID=2080747 RepID=UPI0021565601|nr:zinc-binding dehydrogenase [Streptomyces sp. Ru72]